jgi:hypothetical protein
MNTIKGKNIKIKYQSKYLIFKKYLKLFKIRNTLTHNFIFQVSPPFTYSNSVQNILLQDSAVSAGTDVVVTGWGLTAVRHHIKYCAG